MFRNSIEILEMEQARIADCIFNYEQRIKDSEGLTATIFEGERERFKKKIELANEYYAKHEAAINFLKTQQ